MHALGDGRGQSARVLGKPSPPPSLPQWLGIGVDGLGQSARVLGKLPPRHCRSGYESGWLGLTRMAVLGAAAVAVTAAMVGIWLGEAQVSSIACLRPVQEAMMHFVPL